jgi:hypothetical protein
MNGTPVRRVARSVQLAVMATPTSSVLEAAAEARRRQDGRGDSTTRQALRQLVPAAA